MVTCIRISLVGSRTPSRRRPHRSQTIMSSGLSIPFEMPAGVARIRSPARRMVMLPSLDAIQPLSNIIRPMLTISSRCCCSDLDIQRPDERYSASITCLDLDRRALVGLREPLHGHIHENGAEERGGFALHALQDFFCKGLVGRDGNRCY